MVYCFFFVVKEPIRSKYRSDVLAYFPPSVLKNLVFYFNLQVPGVSKLFLKPTTMSSVNSPSSASSSSSSEISIPSQPFPFSSSSTSSSSPSIYSNPFSSTSSCSNFAHPNQAPSSSSSSSSEIPYTDKFNLLKRKRFQCGLEQNALLDAEKKTKVFRGLPLRESAAYITSTHIHIGVARAVG